MPIKCTENGSWLPLAIEYGFIYSEYRKKNPNKPPQT